ncbi:DUF4145 domain-containing protein [Prevotella melaninogenica]|uniref:DUF4145 domain-containing protein n=1 Tax=Prevotella melaninogenica TaxID=28132 RepID=A0A7D4FZ25_9BACT|nr:DUF4145 domain-containing protein [Prevotella melaninogenica]EFC72468.1 hypothetical protein HMPREF0660_01852 [Prevotella melaninogenica D18]QKH89414.1 DUF4145 domain-containing protein [Prevotella melaninogenica]
MNQKYVTPARDKDAFTCPHCHTLSLMKFRWHRHDEDVHFVTQRVGYGEYLNQLFIARCVNCGKKIIWINDDYIYPDIVAEDPNVDMPESVKQLYNEAGTIYNKSPRAACALLRLAIDRLCNELGETDRDINKNIGILVKKGLPQAVQQALDVVRVVGNKAVHPGVISFDVDDKGTATMLMHLLNIITERMITEPKEIESLYEGLPETVKESITKRDK